MKVYAAAWWDNYYPIPDNVGVYFQTTEMPISSSTRKDKNTAKSYRSTIVTEFLPTKWRSG